MTPPVALTIAGSDSGGGAGIQADLKTFAALGVFGTSAVTAVTAQNTRRVSGVHVLPAAFVDEQIAAVLADLPVRAVKTGMLANADIVALVADRAGAGDLPNLVVDPVLVSSNGDRLFDPGHERAYLDLLFPRATVVTPNLREAAVLLDRELSTVEDMAEAAAALAEGYGAGCVVVKGGHATGDEAVDVVWHAGTVSQLRAPRLATSNTHGTGCTLAAAIAAGLAAGRAVADALAHAKTYVTRALAGGATWRLGAGHGPLDHFLWEDTR